MKTTTFSYTDPREFDGSPFDAAHSAGEQLIQLLKLSESATADTFVIARAADLQRQQDEGIEEPDALAFEDGYLGKALTAVTHNLRDLTRRVEAISQAASYDPRNPPKEE